MAIRLLSSENITGNITVSGTGTFAGSITCNNVASDKKIAFRRTGGNNFSIEHDSSSIYFYNETTASVVFKMANNNNATFAGNILMGNTVTNPASGFADQTGIGLKNSTTVPEIQVSSDSAAMQLGRTSTGGEGQILGLRKAGNIIHNFDTNNVSIGTSANFGGNVGIGTSTPDATLELYNISQTSDGDGSATETLSGQDSLLLQAAGGGVNKTTGSITWRAGSRRRAMITSVQENADGDYQGIAFYTKGTDGTGDMFESMRIAHSGNVGIGTDLPYFPLTVNGIIRSSTSNVGYLYLGNTTQGTIPAGAIIAQRSPSYSSTGKLLFQVPTWGANTDYGLTTQMSIEVTGADTKAATMVLLEHGGKVGIGTTAPSKTLQVSSSATGDLMNILCVNTHDTDGDTASIGFSMVDLNYQKAAVIFERKTTQGRGSLHFATNNVVGNNNVGKGDARMTILSGGDVGIGTTLPAEKLEVSGSVKVGNMKFEPANGGRIGLNRNTSNGVIYDSNYAAFQINGAYAGSDFLEIQNYASTGGFLGSVVLKNGNFEIGGSGSATTRLHVKDRQDSSLFSGLVVERSANTTGVSLNAVGGALNLNTNSSMPIKLRIQNTSMQTINTDGGRAYAANASGLNMKEYGYNFTAANGVTVDLIENSSAHSDVAMVQISITAYHSSRTFFAGMGTFGGYGMALTGAGIGMANGGLTSTVTGTGTRKLQWTNSSGYNASVRLYIQIRTESGITVLNGTLSTL